MKLKVFKAGNIDYSREVKNKKLFVTINGEDGYKTEVIISPVRSNKQDIIFKQEDKSFLLRVTVKEKNRIEFKVIKKYMENVELTYELSNVLGIGSDDGKLSVLVHMLKYRILLLTITDTNYNMLTIYIYY